MAQTSLIVIPAKAGMTKRGSTERASRSVPVEQIDDPALGIKYTGCTALHFGIGKPLQENIFYIPARIQHGQNVNMLFRFSV